MKIAISHCPLWTNLTPHYSVALLGACLTKEGHDVVYPEIEIEFFHHVSPNEKHLWQPIKGEFWDNPQNVEALCEKYREEFFVPLIASLKREGIDLLALSVNNRALPMTRWLTRVVRQEMPELKIIAGGPTSFSAPHLIWDIPGIDAVCLGEGEVALIEFIRSWQMHGWPKECAGFALRRENGEIANGGLAPGVTDPDSLPFPDYGRFNLARYQARNTLPTTISRGCIQRCAYCAESPHFGKFRSRSGANLFSEILHHFQRSSHSSLNLLLNDSLINGNIPALEEFADCLIEQQLPVTFGGMAVSRREMTLDVLKKLSRAGCCNLSFGVESGSPEVLKIMRKNLHTPESTLQVLKDCKKAGITTTIFIIVGSPGEAERHFYETIDFLRDAYPYIDNLMVNMMQILEGSHVARYPERYGLTSDAVIGGSFRTEDGNNTPETRKKRQEMAYLLFQEKMSLLNEIGGSAFDPVKALRQRTSELQHSLQLLEAKSSELAAHVRQSPGQITYAVLWDREIRQNWQFNDQLRLEADHLVSLGDDPFMISPPLPSLPMNYVKVALWHDRPDPISIQLFWLDADKKGFSEEASCKITIPGNLAPHASHTSYFCLRQARQGNLTPISRLRLDPLETPGAITVHEISMF